MSHLHLTLTTPWSKGIDVSSSTMATGGGHPTIYSPVLVSSPAFLMFRRSHVHPCSEMWSSCSGCYSFVLMSSVSGHWKTFSFSRTPPHRSAVFLARRGPTSHVAHHRDAFRPVANLPTVHPRLLRSAIASSTLLYKTIPESKFHILFLTCSHEQ